MKALLCAALALWSTLCAGLAQAAVSVADDSGRQVVLARPAQRVISMAPHVTELLFAAGGGARIVDGAAALCQRLDDARQRRKGRSKQAFHP